MAAKKQVIGGPYISRGRTLSRVVCETIKATLAEADCTLDDVVKAMVWLRERNDFPGFNAVFGEYFPVEPPARSAVLNELLVNVRVEVEVIAYKPLEGKAHAEI